MVKKEKKSSFLLAPPWVSVTTKRPSALKWNDSVQLQFCVFILGVICSSYAGFADQHDLLFCYWALVQPLSSSVVDLVPLILRSLRSSSLLTACPLAGFTTVPAGNLILWLNFLSKKKRQGHTGTKAKYTVFHQHP